MALRASITLEAGPEAPKIVIGTTNNYFIMGAHGNLFFGLSISLSQSNSSSNGSNNNNYTWTSSLHILWQTHQWGKRKRMRETSWRPYRRRHLLFGKRTFRTFLHCQSPNEKIPGSLQVISSNNIDSLTYPSLLREKVQLTATFYPTSVPIL